MLQYTLTLDHPSTHLFGVEIAVDAGGQEAIEIEFPAWSPGRYFIYDFARNVQEMQASGDRGARLEVRKVAKGTWRVDTAGQREVRISYRMYGDTLSGTFSQLDDRHASINGSSLFGYIVGREGEPIELVIEAPEGWKVYSSLKPVRSRAGAAKRNGAQKRAGGSKGSVVLAAENYDVLIDSPIEIGTPVHRRFVHDGITYHVVLDFAGSEGTRSSREVRDRIDRFVADTEKTVRAYTGSFGKPEFDAYWFLVNLDPYAPGGDGMEHLTSTRLVINGYITSDDNYESLVGVMSHEFFHIWNVKRLRPAELGPFDYTRERHTTLLWFAEGFTQYYGHLMLRRAGVWDEKTLYKRLADELNAVDTSPGRFHRNLRDSSFDTWQITGARSGGPSSNFRNTYVNYYHKGAVVAWMLDMELRRVTGDAKSLDDVIRELYRTHYHEAEHGEYFLRGEGYTEQDVYSAITTVAGRSMRAFLKMTIESAEEIDYARHLRHVGLEVTRVPAAKGKKGSTADGDGRPERPQLFTGVIVPDTKMRSKEPFVGVANVLPGSPAEKAGISPGDLIIAVDGERVDGRRWDPVLEMKRPGDRLAVTLFRGPRLLSLDLPTEERDTRPLRVEASKRANEKQVKARERWLAGR